jgi:uncharacterized membrane protein (DUF4010 family)
MIGSTPDLGTLFLRFGLALVLGFLIGLEREREKDQVFAGMRTFALISLLGAVLAFAGERLAGSPLFIAGFLVVSAFGLLSHYRKSDPSHIGITTEVAFLLAYVLGGLVYWDMLVLAAAVTVVIILLLTFKPNLQRLLENVEREDIWAGVEFAVVWIVVLPILPDHTYGPLDVLNPHEIWLTVVFVAALNLAAYILSIFYGVRRGIGLTGILGGLISSTAVTYDFSRRSQKPDQRKFANMFALAIAVASAAMFLRVVVLTLLINPSLGVALILPMLAGTLVTVLGTLILWWQSRNIQKEPTLDESSEPRARSPFALGPALQFGLIFGVVLFVSKAAQVYLADTGAYLSGVLGGIAGLDAVTLSMARLANGTIPQVVAARSVTLAAATNMVVKGIITVMLGRDEVRLKILPLFVLAAAVSLVVAFLGLGR